MCEDFIRKDRYLRLQAKYLSLQISHRQLQDDLKESERRNECYISSWFSPNQMRCINEKNIRLMRQVEEHRMEEAKVKLENRELRYANHKLQMDLQVLQQIQPIARLNTQVVAKEPVSLVLPSLPTEDMTMIRENPVVQPTESSSRIIERPKRRHLGQRQRKKLKAQEQATKISRLDQRVQELLENLSDSTL